MRIWIVHTQAELGSKGWTIGENIVIDEMEGRGMVETNEELVCCMVVVAHHPRSSSQYFCATKPATKNYDIIIVS